jgi:hypothetical protein
VGYWVESNQSMINHGLFMGGEQLERDKLWVTE